MKILNFVGFRFSKSEAVNTKISCDSQQIYKMIFKRSVPNDIDGCWYHVKQVPGSFGNIQYILKNYYVFSSTNVTNIIFQTLNQLLEMRLN